MKKYVQFLLLALCVTAKLQAQSDVSATETVKATEFSIPAAPAYMLLDASSPLVNQPGNIRDFKVDWSLRSYRLQPNLALEGQPLWEIFYNRPDLSRYQKASGFMRTLSTLSLSAGTLQKEISVPIDSFTTETKTVNQLAVAVKINLYRQHDPLLDEDVYKPSMDEYFTQKEALNTQITALKDSASKTKSYKVKNSLEKEIESLKSQLGSLNITQKEVIKGLRTQYLADKWNTSMVDLAWGKVYNFTRPTLDSLDLMSSGYGIWANGGYGIGRKGLLSGTMRYTQIDTLSTFAMGANFRYGSPRFNFFAETLYNILQDETAKDKFTIAYGGDFRVGNNVIIGYSIRTVYDENLKFRNLIPVANINCLMR
ncbi:MAG: hypothetical protein K1X92_01145 [Bacteroidia bacterium]|nr:hypothetical protein [Bacteroidia bacterium]